MADAVSVNVSRQPWGGEGLDADLRRARLLATFLDAQFSFAGFRFGIDAILGLVPAVGDTLGALAGLYPLILATRYKVPRRTRARMGLNLLIEWLIGFPPLVGDLLDVAYKANLRNVDLLERALHSAGGSPR